MVYHDPDTTFIVFAVSFVLLGVVFGYLNSEKLEYNQAKIVRTYVEGGTSACIFDLHGNIDNWKPCAFHVGDNVTVFHDGFGVWRIQQ